MSFSTKFAAHLRANVIGYLALFVALGGVAWAAPQIGSPDIRDGSIRSVDIRDGQLTADDANPASLQRRITAWCSSGHAIQQVFEDGTVTCVASGGPPSGQASGDLTGNFPSPQIAPGAIVNDDIANNTITGHKLADNTVGRNKLTPDARLPRMITRDGSASGGNYAFAVCPAGTVRTGGGANTSAGSLIYSQPGRVDNGDGWWALGTASQGTTTAFVLCATAEP
jgi:hypothetical protein